MAVDCSGLLMLNAAFHRDFVGFADPDKDRSILKDNMGRYRLNIFREVGVRNSNPIYTMHEDPRDGLPSAYQVYMFSESEYEAAMKLVGSWAHWLKLVNSPRFMNGVSDEAWLGLKQWREEKEIKDKAYAYTLLKLSAGDGNVQAQKALLEGDKETGKRGRPSKAEIAKAAQEAAKAVTDVKSDFSRIRLAASA